MSLMKIRRGLKREGGFTLIELVVVMAILALLAALVVPRFVGILSDSEGKADLANKEMLNNACDLYAARVGSEVTSLTDLVSSEYIKAIPKKPNSGDEYTLADLERD